MAVQSRVVVSLRETDFLLFFAQSAPRLSPLFKLPLVQVLRRRNASAEPIANIMSDNAPGSGTDADSRLLPEPAGFVTINFPVPEKNESSTCVAPDRTGAPGARQRRRTAIEEKLVDRIGGAREVQVELRPGR